MSGSKLEHIQSWVGRAEEKKDVLALEQATRMAALFDLDRYPAEGEELPALWHWAYFAPHARQSLIDVDGHPVRGGFLPPVELPRRMWAGSRVRFLAPITIGQQISRRSEILTVAAKEGKQGRLTFVTVRHLISNDAGIAIDEEQDIVYREAPTEPQSFPVPVATVRASEWRDNFNPDAVTLFRYSALTYNAHRIHYDLPYTIREELYPGLVVQGPMTATLLLHSYIRHTGKRPAEFSFRGQLPLFSDRQVKLCGKAGDGPVNHDLWAEGEGGYVAMTAQVTAANT